jgi:hypothetical protein
MEDGLEARKLLNFPGGLELHIGVRNRRPAKRSVKSRAAYMHCGLNQLDSCCGLSSVSQLTPELLFPFIARSLAAPHKSSHLLSPTLCFYGDSSLVRGCSAAGPGRGPWGATLTGSAARCGRCSSRRCCRKRRRTSRPSGCPRRWACA